MGAQYKVGDRVRIVSSPFCGETRQAGAVGTVSRVPSRVRGDVEIDFEGFGGKNWGFYFDEIEHVGYTPAKGDRVRVVLEGEVSWVGESGSGNFEMGCHYIDKKNDKGQIVSVEKIEPPVEVFKPGDVVQSSGFTYTVGRTGYISHQTGDYYPWDGGVSKGHFTSRRYERVNLS